MSTFKGQVVHVGQTEQVSDKFRKRLLVVTDNDDKYPQEVPFEFTQDNVDKLNAVKVGDTVDVSYNLKGNKWKEKWYANVTGWKVDVLSSSGGSPAAKSTSDKEAAFEEANDDLPF